MARERLKHYHNFVYIIFLNKFVLYFNIPYHSFYRLSKTVYVPLQQNQSINWVIDLLGIINVYNAAKKFSRIEKHNIALFRIILW